MRCRYFTLEHKQVMVLDLPLILPVCRCALTELMLERLRTHPDGQILLPYLEGPPLDDDTPRPVIGADHHPISPQTCTEERKESQCIPGFLELLTDLGLDTSLPHEAD